jgi:hypothetical protein
MYLKDFINDPCMFENSLSPVLNDLRDLIDKRRDEQEEMREKGLLLKEPCHTEEKLDKLSVALYSIIVGVLKEE